MAQLIVYLDATLKGEIEQVALASDRSVSYVVRQWIEQGMQNLRVAQGKADPKAPQPLPTLTLPQKAS